MRWLGLCLALLAWPSFGCRDLRPCRCEPPAGALAKASKTGSPNKAQGVLVATVGQRRITLDRLLERMDELPAARKAVILASKEHRQSFLEELINEELLLAVARERGYQRDPRLQRVIRHHLMQNLTADIERLTSFEGISDGEAKRFFEANPKRFVRGTAKPPFAQIKTSVKVALLKERRAKLHAKFLAETRHRLAITRDLANLELVTKRRAATPRTSR